LKEKGNGKRSEGENEKKKKSGGEEGESQKNENEKKKAGNDFGKLEAPNAMQKGHPKKRGLQPDKEKNKQSSKESLGEKDGKIVRTRHKKVF